MENGQNIEKIIRFLDEYLELEIQFQFLKYGYQKHENVVFKEFESKITTLKEQLPQIAAIKILPHEQIKDVSYSSREQSIILSFRKLLGGRISRRHIKTLCGNEKELRNLLSWKLRFLESRLNKHNDRGRNIISKEFGRLNWELLPSGEQFWSAYLSRVSNKFAQRVPTEEFKKRIEVMDSLDSSMKYIGIKEFEGYVVLLFDWTTKVYLDNPIKGNTAYIMTGDWRKLSRLSKSQLLGGFPDQVDRVIHKGDWKEKVLSLLNSE